MKTKNKLGMWSSECGVKTDRKRSAGVEAASALPTPHSPRRTSRAAFSLVEILVVIVIIMILLGIGIAYGPGTIQPAEKNQTRTTLNALEGVNAEFERLTGSPVDISGNSTTYVSSAPPIGGANSALTINNASTWESYTILRFVSVIVSSGSSSAPAKLLSSLSEKVYRVNSSPNWLEVDDAWGKRIVYVQTGVSYSGTPEAVMPKKPFSYFASAGPDGSFGDYRQLALQMQGNTLTAANAALAKAAADNIYSYEGASK
ncbi:MAG: hypothetical protein GC162_19795 [Planctomycetes bacterium]|nr:hypothetical protein [Planctomycetota bacterium]